MDIHDENFISIHGWMRTRLGLKGNALLIYAVIYGFSQDGASRFTGSRRYLAEWCGCSVRTVSSVLDSLVERGLIEKYEKSINGVRLCDYAASSLVENSHGGSETNARGVKNLHGGSEKIARGVVKKLHGGSEKIAHHNIEENIEEIDIEENIDTPLTPQGGTAAGRKVVKKSFDLEGFDTWYQAYPRHEGKKDALKAWTQAEKHHTLPTLEALLAATQTYARSVTGRETRYIALPATWLRGERWDDETRPDPRPATHRDQVIAANLQMVEKYRQLEAMEEMR